MNEQTELNELNKYVQYEENQSQLLCIKESQFTTNKILSDATNIIDELVKKYETNEIKTEIFPSINRTNP